MSEYKSENKNILINKNHIWFSNPLDWTHINRMILFGFLVLITPLAFGVGLFISMIMWPQWFNFNIAIVLLLLYVAGLILLSGFIYAAFKRRKHQTEWYLMENVVIGYYLVTTYVESWLSGLHFTAGLLLVFLGITLISSLGSLKTLYRTFYSTLTAIIVAAFAQLSGNFSYAPLFKMPIVHHDGSPVMLLLIAQILLAIILMAILFISLSATKRWKFRENSFYEMSTIDGLTGLLNRRSFIDMSEYQFQSFNLTINENISFIMLDIDYFKSINDTYGHQAGDEVIRSVANIIKATSRQQEIVGRYGGEEFAIVLPSTRLSDANLVAERMREKISQHKIRIGENFINVTASFGVAVYPHKSIRSLNDLIKAADDELYRSKNNGRNLVSVMN